MPTENDDLPLEVYWDALRGGRRAAVPPKEPSIADRLREAAGPGDLVFGTDSKIIVIIRPSGELVFGPGYTPDEAATLFWRRMGQERREAEDRSLINRHMEALLVRLGRQDLECERLRLAANNETNPDRKQELDLHANLAISRLELIANEAIELGRGLARRNLPVPEIPATIPASIASEESNYRGRDVLS